MAVRLLKFGVVVAWTALLVFPLTAGHISEQSLQFVWRWDIFSRLMLALVALGLALLAYLGLRARRRRSAETKPRPGLAARVSPRQAWLALGALALAFPWFADNYARDVAINVLIYISLGLGLNLVVGLAGLLDLGYIAFYAVGAYTYALLNTNFGLPFWLSLPIGCVISAGAGAFIGYPTLKMRGDYLAIVTLGFGEIVRIVLNNWNSLTDGPNGILGIAAPGVYYPKLAGGSLGLGHFAMKDLIPLYFVALALAGLVVVAVGRINDSRVGRAWVALREDETAAELTGIHTTRYKLLAYVMGAIVAGLAGAFFAAKVRYVNPSSFIFLESALVLCIVVLGGMGSIPGIILGAAAIIALPEAFRQLEVYRMLAFGGAMAVMMIFRPEGLVPARRRRLELHAREPLPEEKAHA